MTRSLAILFIVLLLPSARAHPGSGIAVDARSHVFFADTGKGIWEAAPDGELRLVSSSALHWLAMAPSGARLPAPGGYFEHVSPAGANAVLVLCSDFPCAVAADGSIIFADTRSSTRIVKRTAEGRDSVLSSERFHLVTGLAIAADGTVLLLDINPDTGTHALLAVDSRGGLRALARDFIALPPAADRQRGNLGRGIACDRTGSVFIAATAARAVVRVDRAGLNTVVLRSEIPWSPTAVAVHENAVYVLEYTDAPAGADGSDRSVWVPRVRKIGVNGEVGTVAVVRR
jgi:hypothetical protein